MKHTPEEIKYRLSDLDAQIGNIALDYIAELEAQIEKMKNCRNCKKFMIEGVCGYFLQVGWCKNWEMTK